MFDAVVKPKERSMMSTSLSIVLGMPTTAIFKERFLHSSEMALAPRCVPKEREGEEMGVKLTPQWGR